MVFIRFKSFNIITLLVVSFALHSLFVNGERRLVENSSGKETQQNDVSMNKEVMAGMSSGSSKARIGGRKKGGEMGSRSSKDKINASKEGPQPIFNNQGQENKLINPSQSSCSGAGQSSDNTNKIHSNQDQSEEWKKLLDKKVMQMMRRDYSGMRRPRRKPPINNNDPRN